MSPSFYQYGTASNAYDAHTEAGGPVATHPLTAAQDLEFLLVSAGTAGAFTGTGYVVFGFGR